MKSLKAECIYTLTIPKPKEDPDNCQDACSINPEAQRFAISDGVTKSFLSADWARLLVENFTSNKKETINFLFDSKDWTSWMIPIQKEWERRAKSKVEKLVEPKYAYMRNQLAQRDPAAATFIGLQKKDTEGSKWGAIIIGDSCLFHFSNKFKKVFTYPMTSSTEFNSHPGSLLSYSEKTNGTPTFMELSIEAGDYVLMCTDALSKLLFQLQEKDGNLFIKTASLLLREKGIKELIESFRSNAEFPLESDDIGIIALSFVEDRSKRDSKKTTQVSNNNRLENLQPIHVQDLKKGNEEPVNGSPEKKTNQVDFESQTKFPKKKNKHSLRIAIFGLMAVIVFFLGYFLGIYKTPHFPNMVVPKGSNIVVSPTDTFVVLEITRDFEVVLLDTQSYEGVLWNKVEYSVWFSCFSRENEEEGDPPGTHFSAYLQPNDQTEVGLIPENFPTKVGDQTIVNGEAWCNIISHGYILANNK